MFLLGRKAMTNLDSMLKSRGITLPTKVRLVKTMVFPGVVWFLAYSMLENEAEHEMGSGMWNGFWFWGDVSELGSSVE